MIKSVKFAEYSAPITAMMRDMLHLEPLKLDIPIDRYTELCEMGVLKSFLWVEADAIKGVALIFVSPSLRNGALINASTDVIWVKPEHRGNSKYFIDAIGYRLKHIGVDYWYISSRDTAPIDGFLLKNSFKPLEQMYYKEV